MCLSLYLQCARLYLKGQRHERHLVANELAGLMCLQLKAVQIHLASSLHEQQVALAAGQENADWAEVPEDGPEALAHALVDAAGRTKGWSQNGDLESPVNSALASTTASEHGSKDAPAHGKELLELPALPPRNSTREASVPALLLGPAGDIFVVVNLKLEEVEVFAEYHQDFVATFEVVSAYRHSYGDGLCKVWPKAVYRQVVLLGNRLYLQLFVKQLPLSKEWLEVIVQLYMNEPCPEQFPGRLLRMKQFLREGVPNLETRYQLAKSLGAEFADITIETASLVYMA